jgi:hypothetical protein
MKIGRNAETGEFVPVKVAKDRPKTHVVETIKYEDDDDKRKR